MFAVIKTGGKQYRVTVDQMIKVATVAGEPGDLVEFGEVLVVGGETPLLGAPMVAGASVAAELVEHGRGPKIIAFKKRRRKNSRRKRGYRDEFSLVRITEILTDGKKPSPIEKKARPARKPKETVEAEGEGASEAAKAPKKPAAKAAAKSDAKPAAKKPAAKKPAKPKAKDD